MSKTLFIFYFLFMFFSIGLFSIEKAATSSEKGIEKTTDKSLERRKEMPLKKRQYKRFYRYSNLC